MELTEQREGLGEESLGENGICRHSPCQCFHLSACCILAFFLSLLTASAPSADPLRLLTWTCSQPPNLRSPCSSPSPPNPAHLGSYSDLTPSSGPCPLTCSVLPLAHMRGPSRWSLLPTCLTPSPPPPPSPTGSLQCFRTRALASAHADSNPRTVCRSCVLVNWSFRAQPQGLLQPPG